MSSIAALLSATPQAPQNTPAGPKDDPKRIRESAGQFEALLIGQMLRQVRESGSGGWMGEGEDQAGSNMMGLAEEQLAQVLASQGGLGLASLVARGLSGGGPSFEQHTRNGPRQRDEAIAPADSSTA